MIYPALTWYGKEYFMEQCLHKILRFIVRGYRYVLRIPRKIAWAYIKSKGTNKPIITRLGKRLKARIYPNDTLGPSVFIYGCSERLECSFVIQFLKEGMVFFDVGANFGQYTLLAADKVGQTGGIHSFEPSDRLFEELKYNVAINNFQGICNLNCVAVSDSIGTAQISKYEEGAEVFGSLGTRQRKEASVIGSQTVETITLDSYVKNNRIHHVDLIKMDIEGAELLALRGASELLRRDDAPAILLEASDVNCSGFSYKAIDILDYLESLGYIMYEFDSTGALICANNPSAVIEKDYVAIKVKAV